MGEEVKTLEGGLHSFEYDTPNLFWKIEVTVDEELELSIKLDYGNIAIRYYFVNPSDFLRRGE